MKQHISLHVAHTAFCRPSQQSSERGILDYPSIRPSIHTACITLLPVDWFSQQTRQGTPRATCTHFFIVFFFRFN